MKMIEDLRCIYPTETSRQKAHYAIYECPYCGKHFKAQTRSVKDGKTKSCGCLKKTTLLTHGLSKHRLYDVWIAMRRRCYDKKFISYKYYGGQGITVCDEWRNDFMAFYNWSMANGYEKVLQIDRIDSYGNYCPDNCRWITQTQNNQNKKLKVNNTSGYTGVVKSHGGPRWQAQIKWNKGQYSLGCYETREEAALAYNEFVIKNKTMHRLNVIPK
jgi:hypothetical protein